MRHLYSYNPPEVAFHIWISNFPFSGHPLDDNRFYSFVFTVHRYKQQGKRWRNKSFFVKKIREYGHRQDESELISKYNEMIVILDFLESNLDPVFRKQSLLLRDEFEYHASNYIGRAVVNNKIVYRDISENDYKNNKVNKKTFYNQTKE